MSHEIDLNKYQLRTDLAFELLDQKEIEKNIVNYDNIKIIDIFLDEKNSKKINKKIGNYITIQFDDITDHSNNEKVKQLFSKKLSELIIKCNIKKDDTCLVIGLGNSKSTPDSLGPLVTDNIIITNHIRDMIEPGFRIVSGITPGVMGETGIETTLIIESVVRSLKPDFVIVIDALASQSIERLNKTIQITDTGIHPGSGIGNKRGEISKDTLNVPVISIGIPTVVDAVSIVSDTINYMYKHYAYIKKNINNPLNKLIVPNQVNYLKDNIKLNENDKKNLFGVMGNLNDLELKQMIFEVLTPIGYNLMVTPKEVDFMIKKLGEVLSGGINISLHKNVEH